MSLGDTIRGEIAFDGDADYFVIDVPAGTQVRIVQTDGITFPLTLLDADGASRLDYQSDVVFKQVNYPLTLAARYFIRVQASHASAGYIGIGRYSFAVTGERFSLGPGDPVALFASPGGAAYWTRYHFAAGLSGELYALQLYPTQLLRIDPSGAVSTVVTGLETSGGIAVDGFGNILVSGPEGQENSIWSIAPSGAMTRFAAHLGKAWTPDGFKITVGPDGDVWAGEVDRIWRFDPLGRLKQEIALPLCGFYALAVSPQGELHFASLTSGCQGIHAIAADGSQRVVTDSAGEMAFDRAGNLYVGAWDRWSDDPSGGWGRVFVFDPAYRNVQAIAHVPYLDGGLVFARDAQGNMTSRLVTAQSGLNRFVEMNGAGARVVGSGIRNRFYRAQLSVRTSTLASAYSETLRIPDAPQSLVWSLETGQWPPGLALSSTGVLSGTPVDTGSFGATVRATSGSQVWYGAVTISVAPVSISADQIADALLNVQPLSAGLEQFLDRHGNNNGHLDGGDLRAFLRANHVAAVSMVRRRQ